MIYELFEVNSKWWTEILASGDNASFERIYWGLDRDLKQLGIGICHGAIYLPLELDQGVPVGDFKSFPT
jgi:hypothetical protein